MTVVRNRVLLAAVALLCGAAAVQADPLPSVAVNIGSQPLADALDQFANQTGLQVLVNTDEVQTSKLVAPQVTGTFTTDDVLRRLLAGSELKYEFVNERTVRISPIATADKTSRVESSPGDIGEDAGNEPLRLARAGESTVRSGEGTVADDDLEQVVVRGAYISSSTVLGKTGLSLRSIPQSISVLTRQRLDDQNISSLPEALKYATGVTVFRFDGGGNFNRFYARGYVADSFLLDGLKVRADANMVDLDLAIFDQIEVLRGPAGLFQGPGEPGVTFSLVRKRASARPQLQTLLGTGSWNAFRGELDATGALSSSGRLRGRAVTLYEDRQSYLHGVDNKKKLIYGTAEYDLTDRSTLSVGATYQDVNAVLDQGLPAFPDGRLLDLPRSTAIIADWNLQDMQTAEAFAELESRFGNGSFLKISARRHERDMHYRAARSNDSVAADGSFPLQFAENFKEQADTSMDVFLSMPFTLAGKSHSWLIGADLRKGDTTQKVANAPGILANIDSYSQDIPEPTFNINRRIFTDTDEYGFYTRLTLRPVERLSATLGGRMSWWKSKSSNVTAVTTTRSAYDAEGEFTPYAGLVFDLNSKLSLYASYTDIFTAQNLRTVAGEQLKARTGTQYETGLKGEFLDGRLNAHAAVFRLTDENRAVSDPANVFFYLPIGKARSEGAETEISGNLSAGWSIGAGYAYNTTKYLKADGDQQGQSFSTWTPKHSVNIWTHYVLSGGPLSGLEFGAGARSVSRFYTLDDDVRFNADGYTVVSAQLGYTFAERHKVALNVENLLDEKYYEKVGGTGVNFYGAPRSIMLTVRSRF